MVNLPFVFFLLNLRPPIKWSVISRSSHLLRIMKLLFVAVFTIIDS